MPPQAQGPMPTQIPQAAVNPIMMQLLKARAQQGAQGMPTGPAPNSLPIQGGTPAPAAPVAAASVAGGGPGPASPTQQVTKAAQQAQSPLMDQETRNIAKTLVQKLLQHM